MMATTHPCARSRTGYAHRWHFGIFHAACALVLTLPLLVATPADAKAPGARHCFNGVCHRVLTLPETRAAVGRPTKAVTTFYDDCRRDRFNPCGLTSSGEAFRPGESNSAASPIYPDGTIVLVRNPRNGESAIVRINNAGPYWGNRTLDLSRAAGLRLGLGKVGVVTVDLTVLRAPSVREARYQRNRTYDPVPGHVGAFASLIEAHVHAVVKLDMPGTVDADLPRVAANEVRVTRAAPLDRSASAMLDAQPVRAIEAARIRPYRGGDDVVRPKTISARAMPIAQPKIDALYGTVAPAATSAVRVARLEAPVVDVSVVTSAPTMQAVLQLDLHGASGRAGQGLHTWQRHVVARVSKTQPLRSAQIMDSAIAIAHQAVLYVATSVCPRRAQACLSNTPPQRQLPADEGTGSLAMAFARARSDDVERMVNA